MCYGVSTRHCQESVWMSSVMSVILDVDKSLKIAKQVTTFQFGTWYSTAAFSPQHSNQSNFECPEWGVWLTQDTTRGCHNAKYIDKHPISIVSILDCKHWNRGFFARVLVSLTCVLWFFGCQYCQLISFLLEASDWPKKIPFKGVCGILRKRLWGAWMLSGWLWLMSGGL